MVIHAPKEESVNDLKELGMMMMEPGFLCKIQIVKIKYFIKQKKSTLGWPLR